EALAHHAAREPLLPTIVRRDPAVAGARTVGVGLAGDRAKAAVRTFNAADVERLAIEAVAARLAELGRGHQLDGPRHRDQHCSGETERERGRPGFGLRHACTCAAA